MIITCRYDSGKNDDAPGEIPDIPDTSATAKTGGAGLPSQLQSLNLREDRNDAAQSANAVRDLDDIPDMDDDDALGAGGVEEPEDEAAAAPITSHVHALGSCADGSGPGNTLSVRTYDCYITYDKFHQVPRMWLSGLSPSRQPLTTTEIFQDIAGDYAQKTVTIEPFPHRENVTMASVHPCKHANVMKKVIERMNGAVREQQRRDRAAADGEVVSPGATPASPEAAAKKKKGWGITSAVKKAAGVGSSSASGAGAGASAVPAEEDVEGLRVDQCEYMSHHKLGSQADPYRSTSLQTCWSSLSSCRMSSPPSSWTRLPPCEAPQASILDIKTWQPSSILFIVLRTCIAVFIVVGLASRAYICTRCLAFSASVPRAHGKVCLTL